MTRPGGSRVKTAEQFEREYAERGGLTVEGLRALGRTVRWCDCGDDGCEGWQSLSLERAAEWDATRGAEPPAAASTAPKNKPPVSGEVER